MSRAIKKSQREIERIEKILARDDIDETTRAYAEALIGIEERFIREMKRIDRGLWISLIFPVSILAIAVLPALLLILNGAS